MSGSHQPSHSGMSRQFTLFLVAGGLAAALNFGSRFVFSLFLPFDIAVVCAFMVGLGSGYLLSKRFVFKQSKNSFRKETVYYVLVNLVALAQTLIISILLSDYLVELDFTQQDAEALAHLSGVVFPVITSFLGHKFYTFRE